MKKSIKVRISLFLTASILLGMFAFLPITGVAATLYSDDFEDGNSTGWSTNGGSWSVVTDGTKVYKQSSTSADARSIAGSAWTRYSVQVKVKPLSFNGTDRAVGLIAMYNDTSNYYLLRLSNTNKVELVKKASGVTATLASNTLTVSTGTWYTIKLVLDGSNLQGYVNDTLLISASDTSLTSGKIGLAASYASAEFDDVMVDDLGGTITPTPTPTVNVTPTPTPTGSVTSTPTPTGSITSTPTPTMTPAATPVPLPGDLYVSPMGSDSNSGTIDQPLKTLHYAVSVIQPGNTIYMRGGTHSYDSTVSITRSGTAATKINIWAYPGEKPVLDYSTQAYASSNRGIVMTGSYWYIKGLEICYAGDNGIKLEGSYNRIENCVFHHNGDGGLQMGFAHETVNPNGELCSYNEIINCDSYLNFDFDNMGGDADGFACKMHNGKGNKFIGCRAWRNGDDGWDLYETDWPVEITNCWTWHNADQTDFNAIYLQKMGKPMSSYQGNGNGFKLGGNGTGGSSEGTHVVKNCVAFDNNFRSKKGFDQNSHKGGVIVHNCTSFGNGYNYMFEDSPNSGAVNEFKNNVSFACAGSLDHEFASGTIEQNNSWNLSVTADVSDFQSLSEDLAKAPRQADGSLPNNAFAKLVAGSDLIDKGVNVGLPYNGVAPDLGAFER